MPSNEESESTRVFQAGDAEVKFLDILDKCGKTLKCSEDMKEFYKKWAPDYEDDLNPANYQGPRNCALSAGDYIPEKKRPYVKVLDVGAGTGYVGEELAKLGFQQIDALDGSSEMLNKLKEKNVYENVIYAVLTRDSQTSIEDGAYDVVTSSGALVAGHIPVEAINEIMRVIKPGGIFCLHQWSRNIENVEYQHLPEFIAAQEGKKWTLLEKYRTNNYMPGHQGLLHVIRKI